MLVAGLHSLLSFLPPSSEHRRRAGTWLGPKSLSSGAPSPVPLTEARRAHGFSPHLALVVRPLGGGPYYEQATHPPPGAQLPPG